MKIDQKCMNKSSLLQFRKCNKEKEYYYASHPAVEEFDDAAEEKHAHLQIQCYYKRCENNAIMLVV